MMAKARLSFVGEHGCAGQRHAGFRRWKPSLSDAEIPEQVDQHLGESESSFSGNVISNAPAQEDVSPRNQEVFSDTAESPSTVSNFR